jgi:hypothetical protein
MNKSDVYELPFYKIKKENLIDVKDNLFERTNGAKSDTNILQHRHKFFFYKILYTVVIILF